MNAPAVDREFSADFRHYPPKIFDLTATRFDLLGPPPPPAIATPHIGVTGDKRINNNKLVLISHPIKFADHLNIAMILPTAMQHHHQR